MGARVYPEGASDGGAAPGVGGEQVTCTECLGCGAVHSNCHRHSGLMCDCDVGDDYECPECYGTGEITEEDDNGQD